MKKEYGFINEFLDVIDGLKWKILDLNIKISPLFHSHLKRMEFIVTFESKASFPQIVTKTYDRWNDDNIIGALNKSGRQDLSYYRDIDDRLIVTFLFIKDTRGRIIKHFGIDEKDDVMPLDKWIEYCESTAFLDEDGDAELIVLSDNLGKNEYAFIDDIKPSDLDDPDLREQIEKYGRICGAQVLWHDCSR